ncbi:MAG: hypothetical protein M1837_002163 [Sclerophora amabilis]|nr:MAG: hypothetical protein M1837_002163 [Sclerophora amabilis]
MPNPPKRSWSADLTDVLPPSYLRSMLPFALQSVMPNLPDISRKSRWILENSIRSDNDSRRPRRPLDGPILRYTSSSPENPEPTLPTSNTLVDRHQDDAATTQQSTQCVLKGQELWEEGAWTSALLSMKLSSSSSAVSTLSSSQSTVDLCHVSGQETGIDWVNARRGLQLLGVAVDQASAASSGGRAEIDSATVRKTYVLGTSSLLRGLPTDLSSEDRVTVKSCLPSCVVASGPSFEDSNSAPPQPSLLHRTVALVIIQTCLLVRFIFPYLRTLFWALCEYERRHRVSEKFLAASVDWLDKMGKTGQKLGDFISSIGDGKAAQMLRELIAWCLLGLIGGIYEGLGEGVVIMGKQPPS